MRNFHAFLYRRLAQWITCEVNLLGKHPLALDNKCQVNSLQDVFLHPFYWQLYGWMKHAPQVVVDLGAHCGHFSMLADLCFQVGFTEASPSYYLIEPNPRLLPVIERNLARSGLCPRHTLLQGLIGARIGEGTLWVSGKNYLSASVNKVSSTEGFTVPYVDLEKLLGGRTIDLLKVDIEGAEFDFAANYPDFLRLVNHLMIEVHARQGESRQLLYDALEQAGLRQRRSPLSHGEYELGMWERV